MIPINDDAEAMQREKRGHLHKQLRERAGQCTQNERTDTEAMKTDDDEADR